MRAPLRLVGIASCFLISLVVLTFIPRRFKYRFTRMMFGNICRVAGLRISVIGDIGPMRSNQTLSLANHISYLDPIVIGSLYPTNFMAKFEVRSWPLIGHSCKAMKHIFVKRECLSQRVSALQTLKRNLQFENVCLFPEGTTTRDRTPARELWKAGSLWAASPETTQIVCLGIGYEQQDAIAWVDDMDFMPHLWSVLKRKQTKVCVAIKSTTFSTLDAADRRVGAKMLCSAVGALCRQAHQHLLMFPNTSHENTLQQEALCNRPTYNL